MAEAVAEAVGPDLGLVISAPPDKIFRAAEEVATCLVELDLGLEVALEEDEEIFETLRLDEDEIFDAL